MVSAAVAARARRLRKEGSTLIWLTAGRKMATRRRLRPALWRRGSPRSRGLSQPRVRRRMRRGNPGRARGEQVLGAGCSDDVGEGSVLDGLVLGGQASVVLALVLLPGRYLELFQEEVRAFPDPVQVPAGGPAA